MILIKGTDRLDVFLSTTEIEHLNEDIKNVEEHEVTVKDKDGNYTDGRCTQCSWFYDSKFEVGK